MNRLFRFIVRTRLLAIALTSMFGPSVSNAQTCNYTTGTAATLTVTPPSPLSVPRDAAIGTQIYNTGQTLKPSGTFNISCSPTPSTGVQNAAGMQPSPGTTLFPIGNTGLSYGFLNIYNTPQAAFPQSNSASSWGSSPSSSYTVQIVKTGPISAGTAVTPQLLGTYMFGSLAALNIMLSASISVTQRACSTSNVTVDMGTTLTSAFKGVGTRGSTTPFAIKLNDCPTGINSVSYQIDATTAVVSTSASVVALSTTSTASGIGVQILDQSLNPVPFGKAVTFSSYDKAGGNFSIPLNAAYYQTGSTVKPGSAVSSVIFTLTYQ